MSEPSEIREQFVILLLGVTDRPVPTIRHVQKELFILSKIQPKIQELFQFEKHYEGPYSPLLQEAVREPLHYDRAYQVSSNDALILLPKGRTIFDDLMQQYDNASNFKQIMDSLRLIRTIYDKLSKEELLFLIYVTYPEFIEFSNVYDNLVKNELKRQQILSNLLRKGLITKDRYEELRKNDS